MKKMETFPVKLVFKVPKALKDIKFNQLMN